MVEAQYIAATMKIVDSVAEQDLLEALLETSKPPLPAQAVDYHYLLAAPFRYCSPQGSRFRANNDSGVFYAAQTVRTAAAELGYWRWRFLQDAVDLVKLAPVAHSAFRTKISTQAVDLRLAPFNQDANWWMHPLDYQATQAFAHVARAANIGAIQYQSVRDPKPSWCVAVLNLDAFSSHKPDPRMQSWWLVVQQEGVIWRREQESFQFSAEAWRSEEVRSG